MKSSRLLVIDDDAIARETVAALLADSDYALEFACSGAKGIEMASTLKPEVILLDVMMPGMDGFEVCRRLRADPEQAEVPIILITALDDRESRLKGLESGADDFLSKPIDSLELEIRLRTLMRVARYRQLVEERKKVDAIHRQLEEQNAELQKLSIQSLQARETEQRHLAMELHDEIGQLLTGMRMLLQNGRDSNFADQTEVLSQALEISDDLLHRVRELSLDLRPTVLDDLGLWAALNWLFQRMHDQTSLLIHHNIDPLEERRFPDAIETTCFRLVQESLTNVVRHATVKEVTVTVITKPGMLRLTVVDSGAGFDLQDLVSGESLGVSGMRERVKAAGGKFTIRSTPGEGTLVSAEFPLGEKENA